MRPLAVEPYIKVYMLIRQDGMYLYPCGYDQTASLGSGFFPTQNDAEMARTKEILSQKPESTTHYHIYEIEIPNPAYKK